MTDQTILKTDQHLPCHWCGSTRSKRRYGDDGTTVECTNAARCLSRQWAANDAELDEQLREQHVTSSDLISDPADRAAAERGEMGPAEPATIRARDLDRGDRVLLDGRPVLIEQATPHDGTTVTVRFHDAGTIVKTYMPATRVLEYAQAVQASTERMVAIQLELNEAMAAVLRSAMVHYSDQLSKTAAALNSNYRGPYEDAISAIDQLEAAIDAATAR